MRYSLKLFFHTGCNFVRKKTNPVNVLRHTEILLRPQTLKGIEGFFICMIVLVVFGAVD